MKYSWLKFCLVVILIASPAVWLYAQDKGKTLTKPDRLGDFMVLPPSMPAHFDINRLPINIYFIKDSTRYVGFIIAGHATHDFCQVASMGVKNFLDSVGHRNSIFSFGVAYDLRYDDTTAGYQIRLGELERTFSMLSLADTGQVRVYHVDYSRFKDLLGRIKDNQLNGQLYLSSAQSPPRVIFKYDRIDFPVPLPYFNGNDTVRFRLPKTAFGSIPDFKKVDQLILKGAVADLNKAITLNNAAISQLQIYDPQIMLPTYNIIHQQVKLYSGIGVQASQLTRADSSKVVREFDEETESTIRIYSISDLRRMCRTGQEYITLENSRHGNKRISTCEELAVATELFRQWKAEGTELLLTAKWLNSSLIKERDALNRIYANLNAIKTDKDGNLLYIDAFLRGWPFDAGDPNLNAALNNWYLRRKAIWSSILKNNAAYQTGVKTKVSLLNSQNNIAGIFQSDDVFFQVESQGADYVITPYKLLGGDFIQVVDRNNTLSQFLSANNYRLVKL